jgi:pyruvate ferredoxin oxidoreductase beta subunit
LPVQTIKYYQTGTFTVGNRLLAEDQRSVQADMRRTNSLNSGHRACQGCGEALGAALRDRRRRCAPRTTR